MTQGRDGAMMHLCSAATAPANAIKGRRPQQHRSPDSVQIRDPGTA